jgi:hypothetical protein
MEATTIILICLTAPSALLILFFVIYELYSRNVKIFRMAVVIVLAWMAALAERMSSRWERAKQEVE